MDTNHDHQLHSPPTTRAWTEGDVAAYLQCDLGELEVLRRIDATFPGPRQLTFGDRWVPALVIAWFTQRPVAGAGAPVAVPAQRKGARRG